MYRSRLVKAFPPIDTNNTTDKKRKPPPQRTDYHCRRNGVPLEKKKRTKSWFGLVRACQSISYAGFYKPTCELDVLVCTVCKSLWCGWGSIFCTWLGSCVFFFSRIARAHPCPAVVELTRTTVDRPNCATSEDQRHSMPELNTSRVNCSFYFWLQSISV
ncbi:hypothetical protein VTI28DRAFT_8450 [Corynascus sepedonium]